MVLFSLVRPPCGSLRPCGPFPAYLCARTCIPPGTPGTGRPQMASGHRCSLGRGASACASLGCVWGQLFCLPGRWPVLWGASFIGFLPGPWTVNRSPLCKPPLFLIVCLARCVLPRLRVTPPPPLCDIPSGCCFFTGPWTVTRSSLRMLRRVAAFCWPLRPVLLLVLFLNSWSPVVGVPGLCWMS